MTVVNIVTLAAVAVDMVLSVATLMMNGNMRSSCMKECFVFEHQDSQTAAIQAVSRRNTDSDEEKGEEEKEEGE